MHKLYQVNTATGQLGPTRRSQLQFNWSKSNLGSGIFSEELRIYHDSAELTSFLFLPISSYHRWKHS